MATYNGSSYLQEQLDSLARQTRLPYELVIVDDRSTDHTDDILKGFVVKAPFPVRIYKNKEHLGYTKTFLLAANYCKGDWVAFCDQDDVWQAGKIHSIATRTEKDTGLLVFIHDAIPCDETMRPIGLPLVSRVYGIIRGHRARSLGSPYQIYAGCCLAFKRSLLCIFPAENLHACADNNLIKHDVWISILAYVLGDVYFSPKPLVLYRRHGRTVTGDYVQGFRDKLLRIKTTSYDQYLKNADDYANIAMILRTVAEHNPQAATHTLLSDGAAQFDQLSKWAQKRSKLYQSGSRRERALILTRTLRSGCYFGVRRKSGYGIRALIKDLGRLWCGGT